MLARSLGAASRLAVSSARAGSASRCLSSAASAVPTGGKYSTTDNLIEESRLPAGNGEDKRAFTYFVLGGARFMYATAARLAVIHAVSSLAASADVLALASVEVDISAISLGQTVTVKWRGKPVFIRRRTPAQIEEAKATDLSVLRDPQPDAVRAVDPEWLVVIGVCTHLGCVPISNAGDYNGWYCPCHGSHYDVAGRIRRGPAPTNLEIPMYKFVTPTKVLLG